MADSESGPSTKKRVAGRQISKENPELDDDGPEPEMGTFKRASDEVLATRKIVKVRRSQPSAPSSNPFAALRMVPPSDPTAKAPNPSGVADGKNVLEVNDGADGVNGVDEEKKKVEEKTDVTTSKDDDKVEGDAVEEANEDVESAVHSKDDAEVEGDAADAKKDVENAADAKKDVENAADAKKDVENLEKGTDEETKEKDDEDAAEAKKDVENVEKGTDEETKEKDDEVKENEKRDASEQTESDNANGENNEIEKEGNNNEEKVASFSSFQQLSSSQNAFTGLAGSGFGTSSFSFGAIAKEGPIFGTSPGSIFSTPFSAGNSNNGNHSAPNVTKSGIPSMQEVPVETGEENEKVIFTADAILYEYLGGWKERGKGELKLNVSLSGEEKARLVMRARGNYRLILNASLYPDMTLAAMEKKGVTFACINSAGEGKNVLTTFALKFKDSSFVEEFRGAVTEHKGKNTTAVKTPENSPKASDESDLV